MLIHDPSYEVPSPNHALMHQYKQFLEYLGIVVFWHRKKISTISNREEPYIVNLMSVSKLHVAFWISRFYAYQLLGRKWVQIYFLEESMLELQ